MNKMLVPMAKEILTVLGRRVGVILGVSVVSLGVDPEAANQLVLGLGLVGGLLVDIAFSMWLKRN